MIMIIMIMIMIIIMVTTVSCAQQSSARNEDWGVRVRFALVLGSTC
jgi:hypothetical protein